MKYKICPYCGAHLDFGEKCDCINYEDENGTQQEVSKLPLQKSFPAYTFADKQKNI